MTDPQGGAMTPSEVAAKLRSLSGALDAAARDAEHNNDLLGMDWGDVDGWIEDLTLVRTLIEDEGRG